MRDIDPAKPGLQPSCAAESFSATPDGTFRRDPLPSCDDSSPPCWRLLPAAEYYCDGYLATEHFWEINTPEALAAFRRRFGQG